MIETIPETNLKANIKNITKEFLQGKTLTAFAKELGIPASRQLVFQWKMGHQAPSLETLMKVLGSLSATKTAKAWARRCQIAILKANGIIIDIDKIINPTKE